MPKRQIQVDEIATKFSLDTPHEETLEQKRQRIAQAINETQNLVSNINSGSRITRQIARDDQVMRKAYRRAVQESLSLRDLAMGLDGMLPLSMSDVMLPDIPMPGERQFLTEEFPTNHDDVIMEDLYRSQPPIRQNLQLPHPPQRKVLTEQQPTPRPNIRNALDMKPSTIPENWRIKRYIGETRNGNEVHVWRVENSKTGSKIQTLFRLEGVASRIALILNETGNIHDSRAVSLINAYEKRDKLLKEARALERSADGKTMKSERLRQIRAEINQLDYKLGV